jgi:hypothetical protein
MNKSAGLLILLTVLPHDAAASDQCPPRLPGGNALLPALVKDSAGILVATLREVGSPELGPPGAADYASQWSVKQVLRGDYPATAQLRFRVQSIPQERRETPPKVGRTYILVSYEHNANQIAAMLDATEQQLRTVRKLLEQ